LEFRVWGLFKRLVDEGVERAGLVCKGVGFGV